jgi:hypothetical protein
MKLKSLRQYVLQLNNQKVQFSPNAIIDVSDLKICDELIKAGWAEKAIDELENKAIETDNLENKKRGRNAKTNNISN